MSQFPTPLTNALLLSRNLNRFDHNPLHLFRPYERVQKHAELHRAKFENVHELGKIFRRQGLFVSVHAEIIEVGEAPFEGRGHSPVEFVLRIQSVFVR